MSFKPQLQVVFNRTGYGYCQLLNMILQHGEESAPRGLPIKELLGLSLTVPNMLQNIIVHPKRDLNYRFMVAEWLWITAGREDLEFLLRYNKNYAAFSDDGTILSGAYGPRIASQRDFVLQTLRKDPDSRQAVLSIWDRNPKPSKDIPCTLTMQFLIRQKLLHVIVNMRSSDAWWGIPYDLYTFCQLGNMIAGELNVEPGPLQLHLGSSHLYQPFYKVAAEVIGAYTEADEVWSPRLSSWLMADDMIKLSEKKPLAGNGVSYLDVLRSSNKQEALELLRRMV